MMINTDTYKHKSNNDGKNENKEPYNIILVITRPTLLRRSTQRLDI